ncbi:glycosyltransferase [Gracilimonas mengyeensis]|nr:glycosyltransferase family 2 protein [Gracilimonas mengyeensis]
MEYLLLIILAYLVFTSLVLIRNWFDFRGINDLESAQSSEADSPLVSICIPARNEEVVIKRCVTSALLQNYPNIEVLVLDDNSTDQTSNILANIAAHNTGLKHLSGEPKPEGWFGKPWACHQLSEQAQGEYLVFIDADTWLEKETISNTVNALQSTDALTIWPQQHFGSFWERMQIPLIYHALFTLLPAKYVECKPRWLPKKLYPLMKENFAAACGQFVAFSKQSYKKIGGHKQVRDEIVEDVALARNLRGKDCTLTMYHGVNAVHCRMYRSHKELFEGLRKNFFAGFGKRPLPFIAMALLSLFVFVLPFFLVFSGIPFVRQLALFSIFIIWLQRWLLDFRFGWNPLISFLHPVSVFWYQVLGATCLSDYFKGRPAKWKGRDV